MQSAGLAVTDHLDSAPTTSSSSSNLPQGQSKQFFPVPHYRHTDNASPCKGSVHPVPPAYRGSRGRLLSPQLLTTTTLPLHYNWCTAVYCSNTGCTVVVMRPQTAKERMRLSRLVINAALPWALVVSGE